MFDRAVTERGAKAYKHVTLWEPRLTIIAGQTGAESQIRFDERWIDKISALPFKTRSLTVHGGRVEYRDERHELPVSFFVTDIELEGSDMAEGLHASGTRGARLTGAASIMGVTDATVDVAFEPRAEPPNVDLDLSVAPMPLTEINPLMATYAEIEANDGRDRTGGAHHRARLQRAGERVTDDPLAEAWGRWKRPGIRLRHLMLERRLRKAPRAVHRSRLHDGPRGGHLARVLLRADAGRGSGAVEAETEAGCRTAAAWGVVTAQQATMRIAVPPGAPPDRSAVSSR